MFLSLALATLAPLMLPPVYAARLGARTAKRHRLFRKFSRVMLIVGFGSGPCADGIAWAPVRNTSQNLQASTEFRTSRRPKLFRSLA